MKMNLLQLLSRFPVGVIKHNTTAQAVRSISISNSLLIRPSQCLYKEPLKKKRKLDPAQIKSREEKRKRKIEKEIKRLERFTQTLKPVEEVQLPLHIQDQIELRKRDMVAHSPEEEEQRALLLKAWSLYRLKQHAADIKMLDRIEYSQQKALDKLREESEELYQAAIQVDETLIPITIKGPTVSPPIKDYESPDGEYTNTSFKWE